MSDLIRRKNIKNLLCDLHVDNISINDKNILEFIDELPTVEAIQVVHCKECEHWGKIKHPAQTERVKVCGWGRYFTGENGYCVYGEKVE